MTDSQAAMLSIASFSLTFGAKKLFADFSLEVARGEKITVSGESGCGKSTLLKTIIGMYRPEAGTIAVEGKPLQPQYLQYIRRRLFYLPQDILPYGDETVIEYLRYPFSLSINKGTAFPYDKMEELLDVLRLGTSIVTEPLSRLSGGERKRVGMLCGLLLDRPLMLLGNSMNRTIITLERFYSSVRKDESGYSALVAMGATVPEATAPYLKTAYRAGLGPVLANLATMGIVSLPGMMTGQILGGSDPFVAIKYQIAIILAIYVATDLSALLCISFSRRRGFTPYGFLNHAIFKK